VKDNAIGHHTSARSESSSAAPNAALLIDFDNVTMGIRSDLQNQLRRLLNSDMIKGKVSVQRAYADWRRYPQYIVPLSEASIDLIFAPAFGANKKNATDIRLAIDALELIFIRPEIGTFILLSGDSDFSALVLKLKEYGKYVIGVGIRESSSDLLIQNCDEYFSYNEITGLAREGEVEQVRRDPWELVVEAVQKMVRDGDVMRSDRLKQVMQGIDPNFDEKDAGFNRFSKFVVSAAQRGLLTLTKMENGQYAVDIGANANVPSAEADRGGQRQDEVSEASAARRKRTRKRSPSVEDSVTLTLSESFELLEQALRSLGAVGANSTAHEIARAKMVELRGHDSDPVFENRRFLRMLRQANDADLIELIKGDGDEYLLKLSAKDDMKGVGSTETGLDESVSVAEKAPKKTKTKRATRKKSTTKRRSPSAKKSDDVGEGEVASPPEHAEVGSSDGAKAAKSTKRRTKTTSRRSPRSKARAATKANEGTEVEGNESEGKQPEGQHAPKRNPRLRHGSRRPSRAPRASVEQEEPDVPDTTPAISRTNNASRRTLGSRRGSRGSRPPVERPTASLSETDTSQQRLSFARSDEVREAVSNDRAPAAKRSTDEPHDARGKEGLIHKLTAAIQKAVGGTSAEDANPE
jgi:uncharacterized protein (TIGR00288 family)